MITPNLWEIIIYITCIIFVFYVVRLKQKRELKYPQKKILKILKNKKYQKRLVTISAIILLVIVLFQNIPQDLKIYFVDVGQGDCCFITTKQHKNILIDSGGNENYDVGKNILLPYLLDRRVNSLDYIFISHFDTDHCNGFIEVMKNIPVKNMVITKQTYLSGEYKNIMELAKQKKIHVIVCQTGDEIKIDDNTKIEILYSNSHAEDLNNSSMVCRLVSKNFSMLFTGDIEKQTEAEIVKMYVDTNKLKSNILKVAHHGSKTSSTQTFLDLVKPKIALIGVGENNTFGHPNEEVLERLKNIGARIYRTDEMGEIVLNINSKGKVAITKTLD